MEQTTITLPLDACTTQQAITAVLRHLALNAPHYDEQTVDEAADYNTGLAILFDCLNATFNK